MIFSFLFFMFHTLYLTRGNRHSSLDPKWLLLHSFETHSWLQMPTPGLLAMRQFHAHRGHGHHQGHPVLNWPLNNLYTSRLALCLCCPLNLHAIFTAAVGGPEGRAKQSEVGLLGLTLGPRAGSLSPGPVGWHVVGRSGLRLRGGLGLECLWGC